MKPVKKNILGMELEEWTNKSCIAHFGVGVNWATLYEISSQQKRQGHATELLKEAKKYYEKLNKVVGGSVALNSVMGNLYKKLGYKEYKT